MIGNILIWALILCAGGLVALVACAWLENSRDPKLDKMIDKMMRNKEK